MTVQGEIVDDTMTIRVQDDGPGFDLDAARSQHTLGLRVVDSLVKQLNGALTSEPGSGTTLVLTARLPGGA